MVYLPYRLKVHHQGKAEQTELKAETWRQALKQRPWRKSAYWIALYGLLAQPAFLYNSIPSAKGMAPLTVGWAIQSLINKMLYRLAHGPVLQRHVFKWVPSSPMTLVCIKLT